MHYWSVRQASLVVIVGLQGVGCATVGATRVKPDDYKTDGVRYWLAMPYVLVKAPVEVSRTDSVYQLEPVSAKLNKVAWTPFGGAQGRSLVASYGSGGGAEVALAPTPFALDDPTGLGAGHPAAPGGKGTKPKKDQSPEPGADQGGGAAMTPATDKPTPAAPAPSAAVEVVWLPDYCQQYAIHQTSVLANLKVKVDLADGWKLSSVDSTADTTAVIGKVLDLAGTALGAAKDLAVEKVKSASTSKGSSEAQQGGAMKYLRKTEITYLKPGLYPIAVREGEDCDKAARISTRYFEYEKSAVWNELVLAP